MFVETQERQIVRDLMREIGDLHAELQNLRSEPRALRGEVRAAGAARTSAA